MEEHVIVKSGFSAVVDAPIERLDIPSWCFSLPDHEYLERTPATVAAGFTTERDDRQMSINVEVIGGITTVQHYIERVSDGLTLVLDTVSDLFAASLERYALREMAP